MAYFQELDDEEDKGEEASSPGGTMLGSGGQGTVTGTGGGQAAGSPKATKSGAWTNLNAFLDANKGAGKAMAGEVKGQVDKEATDAASGGQAWADSATKDIDSKTVKADDYVLNDVKRGNTKGVDADLYAGWTNASYSGPKTASDVSGFGESQQKYKNVESKAGLAKDEAGTQALFKEQFGQGGKQYSRGENRLDTFLTRGDEGGAQTLNDMQSQYQNYGQNFQTLANTVNDAATRAEATTADTRTKAREALKTGRDVLDQQVLMAKGAADEQNNLNAETMAKLGNNKARLGQGGFVRDDIETLKGLGVDPETAMYLAQQGVDFTTLAQMDGRAGAGDFLDDNTRSNYSNLLNLLSGAGEASTFGAADVAKTGKGNVKVNQPYVSSLVNGLRANSQEGGVSQAEILAMMQAGRPDIAQMQATDDANANNAARLKAEADERAHQEFLKQRARERLERGGYK